MADRLTRARVIGLLATGVLDLGVWGVFLWLGYDPVESGLGCLFGWSLLPASFVVDGLIERWRGG